MEPAGVNKTDEPEDKNRPTDLGAKPKTKALPAPTTATASTLISGEPWN